MFTRHSEVAMQEGALPRDQPQRPQWWPMFTGHSEVVLRTFPSAMQKAPPHVSTAAQFAGFSEAVANLVSAAEGEDPPALDRACTEAEAAAAPEEMVTRGRHILKQQRADAELVVGL